jgi:adhesin/invasin
MSRRLLPLGPLLGALLVAQCGGSDITLPSEGQPAKLSIVSGDGQSARVGAALPAPLVVRVTDSKDRPVVGAPITFAVSSGPTGTAVAPANTQTGGDGRAQAALQLGTAVGPVAVSAKLTASQDPALAAAFRASAISADANALTAVSGDGQSAPVGTALPAPLVVQVADGFGNPISGVTITWTAKNGGTVSDASTVTGADGRAQVTRTLGPSAGTETTEAAATGLAGSPVVFTSNAVAGGAATLQIVSGNNQSGAVGTVLAQPLVVRVLDANGNAVAGRAVTWVIGVGGGSANPATSTTAADGTASTQWTLGPSAGANTLSAVVSGVGIAGFSATATSVAPPPSPVLTVATQPSARTISGERLPQQPVIQLKSASGQALAQGGVVVTAAIASGGGTLGGDVSKTTDASGKATFTDLSITGVSAGTVLAFTASGFTDVRSNAVEVVAAGPSQSGSSISASPATIATTATSTVTVTVKDNLGNLLAGAAVTFSATSGSVNPGAATTTAQGTAGTTFTPSAAGSVTVKASVTASGVTIDLSTPVSVQAAAPSQIAASSGAPSGAAGGAASPAPSVIVTDAGNHPVAGVTVVFSVTGGGGTVTGENQVTDASGIATVGGWTLGTDGTQINTLTATAQAAGVSGNPVTFTATIVAGTASQLGFLVEPSPTVRATRNIKPAVTVAVQDRFGNVVKTATDAVTVALTGGSPGAQLSGGDARQPANGVATFSSLKVSLPGTGYQLVASAAGLRSATSTVFTVTQ